MCLYMDVKRCFCMNEDNVLMILKRIDIVSALKSVNWDRDIGDNCILDSDSLLYTNQREPLRLHCKKIDIIWI